MAQTFTQDDLNHILHQNCFEVFELPAQYAVSKVQLDNSYHLLQRKLHPDNFIDHPASMLATRVSAHINDAYNTLNSPLLKSLALLRQHGIELNLDTDKELPNDFLLQQMELYEEIDDVEDNLEQLRDLNNKIFLKIKESEALIAQNFDQKNYTSIIENTKKLAFYIKLQKLVDQKIQKLW